MALFSRSDRTFNLELERVGCEVVERLHVGAAEPARSAYDSEKAARIAMKRRAAEIVREGWNVAQLDGDLTAPVACHAELEATIVDDPEQLPVYSDWLIEHGDPCGELAQLRARAEVERDPVLDAAIAELERTRSDELFGLFHALDAHDLIGFHWRGGWVDALEILPASKTPDRRPRHPASVETVLGTWLALALAAPVVRFLRRFICRREHSPAMRSALETWPRRASVRSLEVAARGYTQELLDALPNLEELAMPGGAEATGHPRVRSISLSCGRDAPADLLPGEWPALETLSIAGERELSALLAELGEKPVMKQLKTLRLTLPVETPIVEVLCEAHPHITIEWLER